MQGRWQLWERAGVGAHECEHGEGRKQGPRPGQARGIKEAEVGSGAGIQRLERGRSRRERLRVRRGRGLVACGGRRDRTPGSAVVRTWEKGGRLDLRHFVKGGFQSVNWKWKRKGLGENSGGKGEEGLGNGESGDVPRRCRK